MRKIVFFVLAAFVSLGIGTQASGAAFTDSATKTTYLSVVGGYALQKSHFAELGVGVTKVVESHHPLSMGLSASFDFQLDENNDVWGIKSGAWISPSPSGFGLFFIYYKGNGGENYILRPEIGVGLPAMRVSYGYNVLLAGEWLSSVGEHVLSVNFSVPVKRVNSIKKLP